MDLGRFKRLADNAGMRLTAAPGALRLLIGFFASQFTVLGGLSPFGAAFVAAQKSTAAAAFAAAGAIFGYTIAGNSLRYTAIALLCVAACHVFKNSKYLPFIASAVACVVGMAYWLPRYDNALGLMLMLTDGVLTLFSSLLFIRIPSVIDSVPAEKINPSHEIMVNKIYDLSSALREVGQIELQPYQVIGFESAFERASQEVCANCADLKRCWSAELPATRTAVRIALQRVDRFGHFDPEGGYFGSHCKKCVEFANSVNREVDAVVNRRQFNARIAACREQIARQYALTSDILRRLGDEISGEIVCDEDARGRLSKSVRKLGYRGAETRVYRDHNGRARAEIVGPRAVENPRQLALQASQALGFAVNEPTVTPRGIMFTEAEPIVATLGVASHKRGGSSVSGDCGAYFKTEDGVLYLILADGMGSGHEAAIESRAAVKMLEKLLKSGILPENALELINSSHSVTNDKNKFVTIDLLALDMLGGVIRSYKYGAAPTYCRRGVKIERIMSKTLPTGLDFSVAPDCVELPITGDNWVVMVTDGVSDGENDLWLTDYIQRLSREDAPGETAAAILKQSLGGSNAPADDMTVFALKTRKRPIK